MSKKLQAIKYNNRILSVLRTSTITNDELMSITRHLDKLTALALRAADRPARFDHLSPELQHDTIMNGTKWTDDR